MKKNVFKSVVALLLVLLTNPVKAQPVKGEFINASIGLGLSAPYDNSDNSGSGFYAQGEYVFGLSKWFGLRPYAGFVLTSPLNTEDKQPNQPEYKVTSKAFMIGGKARILAPIPYVAPYFEVGLGMSVGTFQTYTEETNIKKSGVLPHIPFSIGLALGRKHNVEVAFTYYYHPTAEQFSGAFALGYTFPIKK